MYEPPCRASATPSIQPIMRFMTVWHTLLWIFPYLVYLCRGAFIFLFSPVSFSISLGSIGIFRAAEVTFLFKANVSVCNLFIDFSPWSRSRLWCILLSCAAPGLNRKAEGPLMMVTVETVLRWWTSWWCWLWWYRACWTHQPRNMGLLQIQTLS